MSINENKSDKNNTPEENHLLKTGLGAAGGGAAGAAIGKSVGGNTGAVLGAVAGAVAGGIVGDVVAEDLKEKEKQVAETFGLAPGENEIPPHYSRAQLQALSKPQNV